MNSIIEQSVAWARGEIFEATLTGIAGIAVLVLCAIAWRFGTGEAAAGLRLPLLVAGLLFLGGGVSMFRQNDELIPQMQAAHEADASAFVEAELRRVQSFDAIYLGTMVAAALLFVLAIAIFAWSASPTLRGIGVAFALVGFAALTIDFFSHERAKVYLADLEAAQAAER